MKVNLESTTKIVEFNGLPTRVWEGRTESGIPVHAFIVRVAAPVDQNLEQFERELRECIPPTPAIAKAYPARMVL